MDNPLGLLVYQLALNDQTLRVVRQGASLERDDRFSVNRVHDVYVARFDDGLLEDFIDELLARGVLEGDLISLRYLIQGKEDPVRPRVRIAETMPRDERVRPFLPGKARGWDVYGGTIEVLLGGGVVDRHVRKPYFGDAQVESLVFGAAGVPSEIERLYSRYSSRSGFGADEVFWSLGISLREKIPDLGSLYANFLTGFDWLLSLLRGRFLTRLLSSGVFRRSPSSALCSFLDRLMSGLGGGTPGTRTVTGTRRRPAARRQKNRKRKEQGDNRPAPT